MDQQKTRVQDWMTREPLTARADTSAVEAYERMRDHKIHRLPVVDAAGHLVGIVTRSDIAGAVSFQHSEAGWHEARFALAGTVVGEVMTSAPITVAPDTSMRRAAALLLDHHLSGLPVVEGDRLVGIITESDVFRLVVALCDE
ncbi:MAG TPA: CBS domain-containing protein [Chloroflexaceae bacterium]|nr:CBS domain-containing protein [Chloroflexaceae bacterium]